MLAGSAGKYSRFEIERKFLLKDLPANLPNEFQDIHDTYLPNSQLRLRIERSSSGEVVARKLTQKTKAPNKASSVNILTSIYLTENDLAAIGSIAGSVIQKRRHGIETEKNRITIDVFKGRHEGLILAEIEFLTEEERDLFIPSDSSWTEVTNDPNYSCGFLAHKGFYEA